MRAARRALGVLAQLELAELHAQSIHQQQAPNQGLTRSQDQLDDLRRLNHAYQSGENSQHSAFGAGRHQPRRWRLRVQAAVARALFGRKYAGLAFKAEDRAVHVRLAGEHAGIVHQVARGEVVGAVGDDVELTEQLQRVGTGEPGLKGADVEKWIDP